MSAKTDYKFIKEFFNQHNCKLLANEYVEARTKMPYICSCGRPQPEGISWNNFKQGKRCRECGKKKSSEKQKFNLEYVRQEFTSRGCELLSNEYRGANELLDYKCKCGNVSTISLHNLTSPPGQFCKVCGIEKRSRSQSHDIEYVHEIFKQGNATLLETEYKNSKTKMHYLCHDCGRQNEIDFSSFQQGKRPCCGHEKAGKSLQHSIEYVRRVFELGNATLLEEEYHGVNVLMFYFCHRCEKEYRTTFDRFAQGKRGCCGTQFRKKRNHSLEHVQEVFRKGNATLLATSYKNDATKMPYICHRCHETDEMSLNSFQAGHRACCGLKEAGNTFSRRYLARKKMRLILATKVFLEKNK